MILGGSGRLAVQSRDRLDLEIGEMKAVWWVIQRPSLELHLDAFPASAKTRTTNRRVMRIIFELRMFECHRVEVKE